MWFRGDTRQRFWVQFFVRIAREGRSELPDGRTAGHLLRVELGHWVSLITRPPVIVIGDRNLRRDAHSRHGSCP